MSRIEHDEGVLMMVLLQRVSEARVVIDGAVVGEIGPGLLVLLCAERGDTEAVANKLLAKLLKLRMADFGLGLTGSGKGAAELNRSGDTTLRPSHRRRQSPAPCTSRCRRR